MKATHNPPAVTIAEPSPANILRAAVDYLQLYGWRKGGFFATTVTDPVAFAPACVAGAICTVAVGRMVEPCDLPWGRDGYAAHRALTYFCGYLHDGVDVCVADLIGDWNDENGRTVNDVILTLTDAADEWDRLHPVGGENA